MVAIAPANGWKDIRKFVCKAVVLRVDAVADSRAIFGGIDEDAGNCARSNIHHIIDRPPPLRESGKITGQETQAFLVADRP